jgi:hypothetical protein
VCHSQTDPDELATQIVDNSPMFGTFRVTPETRAVCGAANALQAKVVKVGIRLDTEGFSEDQLLIQLSGLNFLTGSRTAVFVGSYTTYKAGCRSKDLHASQKGRSGNHTACRDASDAINFAIRSSTNMAGVAAIPRASRIPRSARLPRW